MRKKLVNILIAIILCFMISIPCFAFTEIPRREYAVGWQISQPASGFSLKIPYQTDFYIQPIFTVSMSHQETITYGHYALGLRGIYNLQPHQDLLPYTGAALGYAHSFRKKTDSDSDSNSGSSDGSFAYQAFFGVEYQKYLIRPALEVGIGGSNKSDGTFQAGVIFNLSVMYYF
ncbi:MAG TPA: hypothetical protein DDW65_06890 [Firmicutes bacterium]|nr:hypothetical protein [Bacillota bacterium]